MPRKVRGLVFAWATVVAVVLASCDRAAILGELPAQDNSPSGVEFDSRASVRAFPGAEGYGALALSECDRSDPEVLFVTNLNGDGAGSLRDALSRADPTRLSVVVFRTGGTIVTGGMIRIENSCLYIAGQTAPGGGIQIRRPEAQGQTVFEFARNGRAHNVVMRYLRIRSGKGEPGKGDNITILGGHDIILDHLSLQWANDEAIGIQTLSSGVGIRDVTLQRMMITETLAPHNVGVLVGGNPNDDNPALFQLDMHHNLFAHQGHRNPRVGHHKGIKVINNVVYNSGNRVGRTVYDAEVDFIGNYFRKGPSPVAHVLQHEDVNEPHLLPSVYIAGNIADWKQVDDNRDLIRYDNLSPNYPNEPLPDEAFRSGPIASGPVPISVQSADAAYTSVLGDVGANARLDCEGRWVSNADRVDQELIAHVKNRTGPASRSEMEHQDQYGGYPVLSAGTACADTDEDGMPDAFETRYGLDPRLSQDNRLDPDGDGYTNLEEYLNGTRPN
jgi:pectate lyase